jgi:Domain of unknown function (DUF4190)
MQPGYPGPGQDPYGQQQPPYNDPYAQYPPQQPPPYQDPYAQPQPQQPPPYQDPYAQPTSGSPYPTSGSPYQTSGSPYQAPPPAYPSYPVAGYGAPAPQGSGQSNVMGILALIFGIVSIPTACCYLGIALGGAAAVLGYLGMKKADQGQASNRGMALAGLICGGIGFVLGILLTVLSVVWNISTYRP